MNTDVLMGITIPFAGTALGSACVFFMKKQLGEKVQKALTGFAGGGCFDMESYHSGDGTDKGVGKFKFYSCCTWFLAGNTFPPAA